MSVLTTRFDPTVVSLGSRENIVDYWIHQMVEIRLSPEEGLFPFFLCYKLLDSIRQSSLTLLGSGDLVC